MVKERINFVSELWGQTSYFFESPTVYDEKTVKKRWKEDSPALMQELITVLEGIDDFSIANSEEIVMNWITQKEYNTGAVMNAFRLAVVGEGKGPHMFDITSLIGKEETVTRLKRAIETIK